MQSTAANSAPAFPEPAEWLNTARPLPLEELKGKAVLLDFWTYCCINCMHIIPDLKRLEAKYPDELVVIDWQLIGAASGLYDLAYFMGQNLLTEMRREREGELVRLYRDTLTEHGVEALSFERCWEGYRSGLLAATLIPVNGLSTFDGMAELARQAEGAERATIEATMEAGVALTATMLERNVAAILDTGAAELLPP